MKELTGFVVACVVALASVSAAAQGPLPSRFELRQIVLSDAIEDGVEDGRLTAEQAATLNAEQSAIAVRESAFRADGSLSDREVEVLEYLLDLASRHIDRSLRATPQVAQGK